VKTSVKWWEIQRPDQTLSVVARAACDRLGCQFITHYISKYRACYVHWCTSTLSTIRRFYTVGLSTASLRLTDDVRQLEQRLLRSTALHYFAIQTAAVNTDFPSARDDNKIRSYSSAYQCVTVLYKTPQPLLQQVYRWTLRLTTHGNFVTPCK